MTGSSVATVRLALFLFGVSALKTENLMVFSRCSGGGMFSTVMKDSHKGTGMIARQRQSAAVTDTHLDANDAAVNTRVAASREKRKKEGPNINDILVLYVFHVQHITRSPIAIRFF